ncbi:galactose mutarotase-like domain-containing protein [Zychaea mexicana]|uniref:galactose mutarotase-like domain-containing protein n=1 Tax=Zychaea mexicana TaxID=64656 RepID=UPI0022FE7744|nr:galactose mutarotase-like domain-containing protein [Zychaea mexicana]KAI9489798.1 galactose mutarotase-like domain-containing protein [Zychaea mexicana]
MGGQYRRTAFSTTPMVTLITFATTVLAATAALSSVHAKPARDDPFHRHTIRAKGIEASFIEYGATITNLWVDDKHGKPTDIVLGWDDTTQFNLQPGIPGFLGAVVGRYANRIRNGTFSIDDTEYHTPLNENDITTLHGGDMGFNRLNWTLLDKGKSDISFGLVSEDGDEGFPGTAQITVKYSVNDNQEWHVDYEGTSDKDTIMMLSQHTYWNLDAFRTSDTVEDHVMQIASDQYIKTDGSLIPTGEFGNVEGTALDFRSAKPIGQDLQEATECGFDCVGYDNCWIFSDPNPDEYQVTVHAPSTGIQMAVKTDQAALQFYSCGGLDGTLPIKKKKHHHRHHLESRCEHEQEYVQKYGCLVLETENYIDGINNPEWGEEYTGLLRAGDEYTHHAEYHFSIHNGD